MQVCTSKYYFVGGRQENCDKKCFVHHVNIYISLLFGSPIHIDNSFIHSFSWSVTHSVGLGQFHGDGRTILTLYSSICVTMMIDKVWLETSNIRVYERHPVIHLTKGAGYLAWFKVAI